MRQQGVDFESMIANFKHISTHGSFTAGGTFKPWLTRTLASPTSVLIIRHFYIIYLMLASSIGLVLSQYTMDSVFQLINGGTIYALQLMPEAKILAETDTIQPFVNNYFSLSVGFCIVLGLGLVQGVISSITSRRNLLGFRFFVVVFFVLVNVTNFLKPYLHMNSDK